MKYFANFLPKYSTPHGRASRQFTSRESEGKALRRPQIGGTFFKVLKKKIMQICTLVLATAMCVPMWKSLLTVGKIPPNPLAEGRTLTLVIGYEIQHMGLVVGGRQDTAGATSGLSPFSAWSHHMCFKNSN